MMRKNQARNAFFLTLLLFIALWVFFHYNPKIDLWLSSQFYQNGDWLGRKQPFEFLREFYYRGSLLFGLYIVIMMIVSFRRSMNVPKFFYRFFTYMALVANGIVVNQAFKSYFGRARPYKVEEFGGEALFTPAPFAPVHQCSDNCSFVSGEASGAMILILGMVALCGSKTSAKIWVWIFILPMAFMRVMAGKHFLSDVILGMTITALLYWLGLWIINRNSHELWSSPKAAWQDFLGLFGIKK